MRQAALKRGPGLDKASTLTNQLLDQRYQVGKRLGEGGMSYVYLAKDVTTNETVAIKVLTPKLKEDKSSVERLRREAGLAMRLEHPNVCKIFRLGETEDGLIYLVMPYLPGELLSDREVEVPTFGHLRLDLGTDLAGGRVQVELVGADPQAMLVPYVSMVDGATGLPAHLLQDEPANHPAPAGWEPPRPARRLP